MYLKNQNDKYYETDGVFSLVSEVGFQAASKKQNDCSRTRVVGETNDILRSVAYVGSPMCRVIDCEGSEQLQQFGKPTWHPYNFGKTRKIGLPTVWQTNLAKIKTWQNSPPHAHISARGSWLPSLFPSRWEGEKEIKNREGFLMQVFQEVEWHIHNFVSLRIPDVS
jgi:hypothetical protein